MEFVLPLQHCYSEVYLESSSAYKDRLIGSVLKGSDAWLYLGLVAAFRGTDLIVSLEYVTVEMEVPGYPQGVVRRSSEIPLEDQCKIVWLRSEEGLQEPLHPVNIGRHPVNIGLASKGNTMRVASLSIHHKHYGCRGERRVSLWGIDGKGCWTLPGESDEFDESDGEYLED